MNYARRGFAYRYLLGAFPDQVNGSRSGGRRRENRDAEFVPLRCRKNIFAGSRSNSGTYSSQRPGYRSYLSRSPSRYRIGNAPLHDCLVFFWSSCLVIVGCEFRKIRPSNDFRKAAGRVERPLTLRVWTIEIGLLAVLLKRDGNERPCSHQVFGRRLRGRLLTRQNKSENQR
jgi:hypothetical protein